MHRAWRETPTCTVATGTGDRARTEALPGPPVRLLDGGELHFRVQPQAVVEVGGAALGLPDDVEVRQAAEAEVLAMRVRQVAPEGLAQGVEGGAEALGVEHVGVGQIGVGGVPPRELLVPTGALTVGEEFVRDDRKHLQSKRQKGGETHRGENISTGTFCPQYDPVLRLITAFTLEVLLDDG